MRTAQEISTAFAEAQELQKARSLYLVGIGGAGLSGLAELAARHGLTVAGSDAHIDQEAQSKFRSLGITALNGHQSELPGGVEALVISDAIPLESNPEVLAARRAGIPIFRRSQLLALLTEDRPAVAVTGTHGKTTTSSLLAAALIGFGVDPQVVIGASVPEFGGPLVLGKGAWSVVEACEAYNGIQDLSPTIILLTNLELDHEDFHGSYENLRDRMVGFCNRLPENGILFYCEEDAGATEVAERATCRKVGYRIRYDLKLSLPGRHNRLNASGALAVAEHITGTAATPAVLHALQDFEGAEGRLQVIQDGHIAIVRDYAHHPTEIRASIQGLREKFPGRRIIVVFQPHLYSRTKGRSGEFGAALSTADFVFITDIYPAREDPIPGVSSAVITESISVPYRYIPSLHLLPRTVAQFIEAGDVVVGMGAGTIQKFPEALVRELRIRPVFPELRRSKTKVLVVLGGDSSEREVSLLSGAQIARALRASKYEVITADMTDILLGGRSLDWLTGPDRPDVAFLAVHGTHAEDGAIQGLFELLHIPYTGSPIKASAIAMDKAATKQVLAVARLVVPKGIGVSSPDAEIPFEPPYVVKPNAEGSTVGVSFLNSRDELKPAIQKALIYGSLALVEERVVGMEVSVPVINGKAFPVVEIAPRSGVYDFESKYAVGATEEIVPARLDEGITQRCQETGRQAAAALGCTGAVRVDMIVRDGEPVVLEVNTLPGMTETSLLPNSARYAGIPFGRLCELIVEDAFSQRGLKASP